MPQARRTGIYKKNWTSGESDQCSNEEEKMEEIMEAIGQYGLETVLTALLINILTGLIKIPLKKWAERLEDSSKATRFIV